MNIKTSIQAAHLALALLTLLAGCGGGGGGTATPQPPAQQSFAITGQLSGLPDGSSVTLGNGSDTLVVRTNGSFSFPAKLASGSQYSVAVSNAPGLACGVKNGTANVGNSDVTNVAIRCLPILLAGANPIITNITSITSDSSGNTFVLDALKQAIFKVGTDGTTTLYAGQPGITGCQDGPADGASFQFIPLTSSLVVDRNGNLLVSDSGSRTIRKITPARVVITLAGQANCPDTTPTTQSGADGAGTQASFVNPGKMALANNGDLLVTDPALYQRGYRIIRRVTPAGMVSTMHYHSVNNGLDGNDIRELTALPDGTIFFSADRDLGVYRLDEGIASYVAGNTTVTESQDGQGQSAGFSAITSLTHDDAGNLYVGDYGAIRKITVDGTVTTLAGKAGTPGHLDGNGNLARFGRVTTLAMSPGDTLLAGDSLYRDVRSIKLTSSMVSTKITADKPEYLDGAGSNAHFNQINQIAALPDGSVLVVDADRHVIRKITAAGQVGVLPVQLDPLLFSPSDVAADGKGNLYLTNTPQSLPGFKIDANGVASSVEGLSITLGSVTQFTVDGAATLASATHYVPARWPPNNSIDVYTNNARKTYVDYFRIQGAHNLPNGGGGEFTPQGLVFDSSGNLYFGDAGSRAVYKLNPNGNLAPFAGTPGKAGNSDGAPGRGTLGFYSTAYMAIDDSGNLYLSGQGRIRKISPDGTLSTLNLPWGNQLVGSIAIANGTLFGAVGLGVVQTPLP